jgi:hypothetical protein
MTLLDRSGCALVWKSQPIAGSPAAPLPYAESSASGGAPVDAAAGRFLATQQSLGWPTVPGMAIFATAGSLGGYAFMRLGSRGWFHWPVARRARARRK